MALTLPEFRAMIRTQDDLSSQLRDMVGGYPMPSRAVTTQPGKTSRFYILDGERHVPCDDPVVWQTWMSHSQERTVARDVIGEVLVSTVFTGVDMGAGATGVAMLYQSIVMGLPGRSESRIYSTRALAQRGHDELCDMVRGGRAIRLR